MCIKAEDAEVWIGNTAVLYCSVHYNKMNLVYFEQHWRKLKANGSYDEVYVYKYNHTRIRNSPGPLYKYRASKPVHGTLLIRGIRKEDGGLYSCSGASDSFGCNGSSVTFSLTVIGIILNYP